MKYSIVVPTYNHCDDLLKPCLESIFKHTSMSDVEIIVSANGCTDNTWWYLESLKNQFDRIGFGEHFSYIWNDKPLGYPKANNVAIRQAKGQKIILMNNDCILLDQAKNTWIKMLDSCFENQKCGISSVLNSWSDVTERHFAIFFCVMIDRKVFDKIGLLNEDYGVGSSEDIEFCCEAQNAGFEVIQYGTQTWNGQTFTGEFPIYHKAEGTMLDASLINDYHGIFAKNKRKLARKYNPHAYRMMLNNNFERHLSINGEEVLPREKARYLWASSKVIGNTLLEIGCSNGYGSQFFGDEIDYLGLDYSEEIIVVANEEGWGANKRFVHADINTFELGQYDTIVAMEVIEHLDNGLEVAQRLKNHCKRLLVTVPYMETPGYWGEHHRLHMLNQSHLPGFEYKFMGENGEIADTPFEGMNLMLCEHNA